MVAANAAKVSATVHHALAHHVRAVSHAHELTHVRKVAAPALRVRSSASAVHHPKRAHHAHPGRRALMDNLLASHALATKAVVTAAHAVAQAARDRTHSRVRSLAHAVPATVAQTSATVRAVRVLRSPHVQVLVAAIAKATIAHVTHVTKTAT